ncbi:hypothetical protein ACH4YO_08005 [Streptomyces noursei]|uniref:hypothetical protein n=1 Tax=Streptomyces noursei TaxID=1971 RepID=UPI0033CB0599
MNDEVFVFFVSRNSRPARTRVLWRVTREEGKRICSDPRTAGRNHMLCWTASPGVLGEDWEWFEDSGRHTDVLMELGVEPARGMELAAA